jgi:hypothetical protein
VVLTTSDRRINAEKRVADTSSAGVLAMTARVIVAIQLAGLQGQPRRVEEQGGDQVRASITPLCSHACALHTSQVVSSSSSAIIGFATWPPRLHSPR